MRAWGVIGFVAGAVLGAASAHAQSGSSTLSSFRMGYGGAGLSGLESPVSPSLISSGSQFAISDGVNQAGSVGSVLNIQTSSNETSSSPTSGGADPSYAGVGQVAVSAARAPSAVAEGATASVASPRVSTAAPQTSTTTNGSAPNDLVLNGKLNLEGGQ
jgi:hypothetical protein